MARTESVKREQSVSRQQEFVRELQHLRDEMAMAKRQEEMEKAVKQVKEEREHWYHVGKEGRVKHQGVN